MSETTPQTGECEGGEGPSEQIESEEADGCGCRCPNRGKDEGVEEKNVRRGTPLKQFGIVFVLLLLCSADIAIGVATVYAYDWGLFSAGTWKLSIQEDTFTSLTFGIPIMLSGLAAITISAYCKEYLRLLDASTLLIVGTVLFVFFASLNWTVPKAFNQFEVDDFPLIIPVALWLLFTGYAVKGVFDEARDRFAEVINRWRIERKTSKT
jgi:hypothetical protein